MNIIYIIIGLIIISIPAGIVRAITEWICNSCGADIDQTESWGVITYIITFILTIIILIWWTLRSDKKNSGKDNSGNGGNGDNASTADDTNGQNGAHATMTKLELEKKRDSYVSSCTSTIETLVEYVERLMNDDELIYRLNNIKGLDLLKTELYVPYSWQLVYLLLIDIHKCYKGICNIKDDDETASLCFALAQHRLSHSGKIYCNLSDEKELKKMIESGNCTMSFISDLSVKGFKSNTDFLLLYFLEHYGYDTDEYIELLYDIALTISLSPDTSSDKALDYLSKIEDLKYKEYSANSDVKLKPFVIINNNKGTNDSIKELDNLIGLANVKADIKKLNSFVNVQQMRRSQGLKTHTISYHCVFTGNPGTGKTTVARIIAKIYKDLGILKKGHLIETDRSGLVAEFVGQTAVKTNRIIDKALDGVLFIDEAYSLVGGGHGDYGPEAISTLLKRMEDDRDRLVVILAGYGNEMRQFINSNPGLQSRFRRYFHFVDYSSDELWQIFNIMLQRNQYITDTEASAKIKNLFQRILDRKDKNFGNARYARNLFERILENQAIRLTSADNINRETLLTITKADVPDSELL